MGWRRAVAGLGLTAGAVFPASVAAQVIVPDTVRRPPPVAAPVPAHPDSLLLGDSTARRDTAKTPADTIKAPLAKAESPRLPEAGEELHWDREALFASGALTLGELLERVPGAIAFRTGWIASAQTVSYLGDPGRVRVFYDGVELDALDPRTGGVLDLVEIQLWSLEEVRIERGAGELRVHLRSWRHDRTVPNTRVDVYTGDENTNMYRGFLGQRFARGEALQVAGQRYSTAQQRTGIRGSPSGGQSTAYLVRLGWARGPWSADGLVIRDSRIRFTEQDFVRGASELRFLGRQLSDSVPRLEATRTDAYLRGAFGDPDAGLWIQAIAASSAFREATPQSGSRVIAPQPPVQPPGGGTPPERPVLPYGAPSSDSSRSRAQYVVAGGFTRWGLRLSGTSRVRVYGGATHFSPIVRASANLPGTLAVAARAERDGATRQTLVDAAASLRPFPFLTLAAAAEQRSRPAIAEEGAALLAARAEAAVRIARAWLVGGVLHRDSTVIALPVVYDESARPGDRMAVARARGAYGGVRGSLYKDIGIDATAIRWRSADLYRPLVEARTELYLRTRWLSRFPRGQFGLNASAIHDYRSPARFLTATGTVTEPRGSNILSTLVEIRIRNAVVTWQYRNITGSIAAQVPGYLMPRLTNLYGVRWDFFN